MKQLLSESRLWLVKCLMPNECFLSVSRNQSRELFFEKNLLVSPIGNEKDMAS